jgi:hypothetical protein
LLFGGMQEQFVQGLFHHAGFIGASIPGADMMRMWGEFAKLLSKNWKMHCTDGASWDANLSLDILHVVRDLLEAATPILWRRKMIRRYFDQTFVGWVVADGHIVRTFGMTSGCTLTSLGNTLSQHAVLMLHSIRLGWTHADFLKFFKCFVHGDDLIYAYYPLKDDGFQVESLARTYNSLNMWLECDSLEPCSIFNATFLSSTPVLKNKNGGQMLFYKFNTDKLIASFCFDKSADINKKFSKYISILLLLFGDYEVFLIWRERIINWYLYKKSLGFHFENGDVYCSLILDDDYLFRLYTSISS